MQVELFCKRQNVLGESPLWDEREGTLYWVDIRSRAVEWVTQDGSFGRHSCGLRLSALGLRAAGGLVAAGDHAVGVFDPRTGRFEQRVTFEPELPRNRTNDGSVGHDGRFWFGTMDDSGDAGQGALYSVTRDWTLKRALDGLSIPNGILTNGAGTALYAADSGRGVIELRALDPTTGATSPPRELISFADEICTPDGAALDEEGYLWSALWDGGAIMRLAPDGARELTVPLPVSRPTSCAFGGANLTTLFVTSARDGLDQAELDREPLAGSVFAIETGVRGLQLPAFEG